ncbi:MAG: hypothetical protein M5R36_19100 [Deltaproteobacteria bacterium]|nr:hypothetical protein [Deltaproteobacteria bacterium]
MSRSFRMLLGRRRRHRNVVPPFLLFALLALAAAVFLHHVFSARESATHYKLFGPSPDGFDKFYREYNDPEDLVLDAPADVAAGALWNEMSDTYGRITPPSVDARGYGTGSGDQARIIFLGIDGAAWSLLTPLMESGDLPSFRRLLERSSYGFLATDEAFSPVSWTSIASGKRREKTLPGYTNDDLWGLNVDAVRAKRFWTILGHPKGRRLVLLDWYFTPLAARYPEAILLQTSTGMAHPEKFFFIQNVSPASPERIHDRDEGRREGARQNGV